MILPPGVIKALQKAIAQHEEHMRKASQVRDEIRDAVADIGVGLTPLGFEVLTAIAAYMAQSREETMLPAEAVRAADAFMVRWATDRDQGVPVYGLPDRYFGKTPDIKLR